MMDLKPYEFNFLKFISKHLQEGMFSALELSIRDILKYSQMCDTEEVHNVIPFIKYVPILLQNLTDQKLLTYMKTYYINENDNYRLVSRQENNLIDMEINRILKDMSGLENVTEQYIYDNSLHDKFQIRLNIILKEKYNWTKCYVVYHILIKNEDWDIIKSKSVLH